jgi:hypothetical protein
MPKTQNPGAHQHTAGGDAMAGVIGDSGQAVRWAIKQFTSPPDRRGALLSWVPMLPCWQPTSSQPGPTLKVRIPSGHSQDAGGMPLKGTVTASHAGAHSIGHSHLKDEVLDARAPARPSHPHSGHALKGCDSPLLLYP